MKLSINFGHILFAALGSLFRKKLSVPIGGAGGVTLTAANSNGAPVHFSPSMILSAGMEYLATGSASVVSGSTVISVAKNS